MKKKLSYRDKLLELAYIYNVKEIQDYTKNRKNLTTGQIELILKKNKIIIPKEFKTNFFKENFIKPVSRFKSGIVDFKEMPSYYTMADAFFMPSYQETFGYATIEAASCKCPVLLRDNVEYRDFFFNHYLKGQTPDDFAQILTKLKDDRNFYTHWQEESEDLATRYSQKEYMKQLKTLYLNLVPNKTE